MKNRLILLLLSLLGFSTCETPLAYGCPQPPAFRHYELVIEGTVTDKEGHPIPSIVVGQAPLRSVTTERNGKYRIRVERSTTDGFPLTFTDTDGPANGGDFTEKTIGIDPAEAELIEAENEWTLGRYKQTADVVLEERRAEEKE